MSLFSRRRPPQIVIAATTNTDALRALWRTPGVRVREARTVDGVNALLAEARLVVLDMPALAEVRLRRDYLALVLDRHHVPSPSAADFLADPERWLRQAAAYAGDVRSLPPRLVTFTSMASGGVGKTTLTLSLALSFLERTRLPVAVVELTHAASGFLTVLDAQRLQAAPADADAYTVITQGAPLATWESGHGALTVVPMDGRRASLLTPADFAAFLRGMRERYTLTIIDAVQPHPLWYPVHDEADLIFVTASAARPDTIANAQLLLDELGDDERVRLVINMAATADRLAAKLAAPWAGCESLTITRREAVARYADRLPEVTARIWPGVRL